MKFPRMLRIGVTIGFVSMLSATQVAQADPPANNECSTGWCGTPKETGGGGGCGCGGGSILIANTDDGKTYQHTDDYDADGVPDQIDNCAYVKNRDQGDQDGDKRGDACDNCAKVGNADQSDVNGNNLGDMCDDDADSDGIPNAKDNCWLVPNPGQENVDAAKEGGLNKGILGDVCDPDMDGDGVANAVDNCPLVHNPDQKADGIFGKACDYDADKDGIQNAKDNCPGVYNPDQLRNSKISQLGDACNPDIDADKIANNADNCSLIANADQRDSDNDGVGDACSKRYCYVVQRQDKGACLDPDATFQVYSPTLPMIQPNGQMDEDFRPVTGRPVRLRLFANRQNVAIRYTWSVLSRPEGSNAAIEFPQSTASLSTPWEYHYLADRVVTFTPDLPGRYVLKVTGEMVFPDPVNPNWPRNSEYQVTINASGEALSSGCSVPSAHSASQRGGAAGYAALGALVAAGVVLGKRRRQRNQKREGV